MTYTVFHALGKGFFDGSAKPVLDFFGSKGQNFMDSLSFQVANPDRCYEPQLNLLDALEWVS